MRAAHVHVCGVIIAVTIGSHYASAQSAREWDEVIAAAKREGKVTVYTGYLSPNTNNPIARAFEKKYGIKIDYLAARGSELQERVRTEQAAGRYLGDVLHNALAAITTWVRAGNNNQPHGGLPGAAKLKEPFKSLADVFQVPIFTINYGFLINTKLVTPAEEPKSWLDLLEPKWSGKIIADDPRAGGGGAVMFRMTWDRFGRAYHEKLAAQKPVFARDYAVSARRVAQGEYPLYVPYILSDYSNIKGLPVKYILPTEGVTYGSYSASILRNPPHPNAARLLADFYLSDEVQAIYAKEGHGIVIDHLSEKLPPEIAAMIDVKPLAPENFAKIDEMYDRAKEIYK